LTARTLSQAIAEIGRSLEAFSNVRALTGQDLVGYKLPVVAGWEIPNLIDGSNLNLRVLVPAFAPYTPARIAVFPPPKLLSWPHLEEHGLLCLLPEGASHRVATPGALTITLLESSVRLATECLSGANAIDFEMEFVSYWTRWPKCKGTIDSICRHDGPSRWVEAWHSTKGFYVADSRTELENWLRNRFEKLPKTIDTISIPLVRITRALHPAEYPETVGALLDFVSEENRSLISQHLTDEKISTKVIVAVSMTTSGEALFGFLIAPPPTGRRGGGRGVKNGFREPPENVVLARYRSLPIVGAQVSRFDASWVHGRDKNTNHPKLASTTVVILGIGSLGSGIAALMAKSGVGKILLVDSGTTESENASRHELGIGSVKSNKATSMARELQRRFPHLLIEGFPTPAADFASKHPDYLSLADVVISATANWSMESWLSWWSSENRVNRPTIFSWLEPHAAAGHAIVTWGGSPCMRCLFDDLGSIQCAATVWTEQTTLSVPACAGEFQPYGAIELGQCQSIAAQLAVDVILGQTRGAAHRVWLGDEDRLHEGGGEWNPEWLKRHGKPSSGGMIQKVHFDQAEQCLEHKPR
jgi:sulfur-carrier protein adenylyltransferase/sulfurtransferase